MGKGEKWIVVVGWEDFQHPDVTRSKNVPPWIKTYTRLLADDAFLGLSHHQRGVLFGLWLEYARSTRQLRDSTLSIGRRLGQRVSTRDLEALSDAGFIEFSASKPQADCKQLASLDKNREEDPLPPKVLQAKPKTRKRVKQGDGPSHEEANPHVCGVDGCEVRHATEDRIREHRENVHAVTAELVGVATGDDIDFGE